MPSLPGTTETGIASWYGAPYHGRRAANGEIYDMEKMTAAHRTLPFNTWVEVRNLTNDKTVNVRVTDRGPFVGGRIIDLSRAAAEALAMIGPGIVKVRLTVIDPPAVPEVAPTPGQLPPSAPTSPADPPPIPAPVTVQAGQFAVQVGVFTDQRGAERIRALMEERYGSARIVLRDSRTPQWRVLVGSEETQESAEALATKIRLDPDAGPTSFIVRMDPAPPIADKKAPDSI